MLNCRRPDDILLAAMRIEYEQEQVSFDFWQYVASRLNFALSEFRGNSYDIWCKSVVMPHKEAILTANPSLANIYAAEFYFPFEYYSG